MSPGCLCPQFEGYRYVPLYELHGELYSESRTVEATENDDDDTKETTVNDEDDYNAVEATVNDDDNTGGAEIESIDALAQCFTAAADQYDFALSTAYLQTAKSFVAAASNFTGFKVRACDKVSLPDRLPISCIDGFGSMALLKDVAPPIGPIKYVSDLRRAFALLGGPKLLPEQAKSIASKWVKMVLNISERYSDK